MRPAAKNLRQRKAHRITPILLRKKPCISIHEMDELMLRLVSLPPARTRTLTRLMAISSTAMNGRRSAPASGSRLAVSIKT